MEAISSTKLSQMYLFKDKLITYARAHGFDKPNYHFQREGLPHAPCFRASVDVASYNFISPHTFNRRKDAEHFISMLAFQSLSHQQASPANVIANNSYKSILKEYGDKKGYQDVPLYKTYTHESSLGPKFVSSVSFKGKTYFGPQSKRKKEAEQAAARVAIDSILGNANFMLQAMESKIQLDLVSVEPLPLVKSSAGPAMSVLGQSKKIEVENLSDVGPSKFAQKYVRRKEHKREAN